ncbi:FGGY carbohydrate kinase domain-containing protein isoform X7 [Syngnathoides biaculeatus]|uniref:FGGY carbohydrate kinase domain-containing protein isoform X7 n=1 Tax=Syngnathoides biaculeatus TaxID=300417 RepID=UPI002ADDE590|nr:FGGY carbohydrate kinase domain-containing protein isoform X7 [Syngnathoides biaculeatus]
MCDAEIGTNPRMEKRHSGGFCPLSRPVPKEAAWLKVRQTIVRLFCPRPKGENFRFVHGVSNATRGAVAQHGRSVLRGRGRGHRQRPGRPGDPRRPPEERRPGAHRHLGASRRPLRAVVSRDLAQMLRRRQGSDAGSEQEPGNRQRNVVMWMDHRAAEQAARITAAGHGVLSRLGGAMSPEMQPPKLLWLKENLGESRWNKAAHFFDLPDFLSWKATGSLTRSLCTLVCKWTYCPPQGWDATFWTAIGLEDLAENNFAKIGNATCPPGSPVGDGLTREAAADLGLDVGTAVGASLIDAHAGGLGVIGADVKGFRLPCEGHPITSRMAMICGTSSCHMAMSERPLFVPGVWGPCLSAMVPDLWLNEGGQSATGRLVSEFCRMDHVVKGHAAFAQLREEASRRCPDTAEDGIYGYLNEHLRQMSSSRSAVDSLASGLHVWPDFHGNRSPLADPTLKGMVVGLSLSQSLDDLALLYLATVQALALGTLHILEAMKEAGHDIRTVFLCGGLSKNSLFVQIHANATGLPVVLPQQAEAVLVGAAVLGACAAQDSKTIQRRNGEPSLFGLGEVEWRLSWKALPHTFEDPGSNPGPARVEFTSSLRSFSPGSDGENGESGKSH